MTITWTMVMDFSATFAVTTGPWNHSYRALVERRECVIAIPTVDMIDTAVAIGTCSGKNVDKFDRFALTPVNARHIGAPLILECLANIECKVIDIVERSEEHTSELQSLMRISSAVFGLNKKQTITPNKQYRT